MIIIRNIGGNPLGKCQYDVRINKEHIAFFEHNRPDGLTKCLQLAASAVEKAKWNKLADKLTKMGQINETKI